MPNVSILLLLYRTDIERALLTVQSIIEQERVEYEVIVADDASPNNLFDEIKNYVEKYGDLSLFTFISHDKNVGTVENYYDALIRAKGEYIYAISPGDILFDSLTIIDLYEFSKKNDIQLCFGDSIRYSWNNETIVVHKDIKNNPPKLSIFDPNSDLSDQKVGLFFGNLILGVTFFRERKTAIRYFEKIIGIVRYVEDASISFLYSLDGNRIYHLKRRIVWYEHGVGVSSKGNHITDKDYDSIYKAIKTKYKRDPVVDVAVYDHFASSKKLSIIYRLLRHPFLYFQIERIKRLPTRIIETTEQDEKILNERFVLIRRRIECK